MSEGSIKHEEENFQDVFSATHAFRWCFWDYTAGFCYFSKWGVGLPTPKVLGCHWKCVHLKAVLSTIF